MERHSRTCNGPLIALSITLMLGLCWSNIQTVQASERVALVIGNGAYEKGPLRNPVNDAHDMAESLRQLGFEVIHRVNADQRTMKEAIRSFGTKLTRGSVGLFYFSGHGIQVYGRNYLIPIGAQITNESEVEYEAVDAGRILGQMENARNDLNIVILDACRDNPFAKSFRSESRGLVSMDAPSGSLIAYATAPGEVAADGTGRNGIFTKYLLRHMQAPGLTIEQILKKVRIDVTRDTFERQVPWESSSLRRDFYFKTREEETATEETFVSSEVVRPDKENIEALLWESIKDSDDPAFYEEYLERFPDGYFSGIARLKLKEYQGRDVIKETEEKSPTQSASIPSEPKQSLKQDSESDVVARDGRFVAYSNGVVRDTKTDLEWIAGPDRPTDWESAKSWVVELKSKENGWQIPNEEELLTLFEKGWGDRNMTPLLKTTGWIIWCKEADASTVLRGVNFKVGRVYWDHWRGASDDTFKFVKTLEMRAFAVRSGKVQ